MRVIFARTTPAIHRRWRDVDRMAEGIRSGPHAGNDFYSIETTRDGQNRSN
jgi:hypothetical protein